MKRIEKEDKFSLIGLQKILLERDITAKELSEKLNITPQSIWRWFNVNKIPKRYHSILSLIFNKDESYFSKVVNDISTYKPKIRGFANEYKIDGDITYIYVVNRKLKKFTILIDTEDLSRLIEADLGWHVRYDKCTKEYYARAIKTYYDENGDKQVDTILLQRFIMKATGNVVVDHHNHNRLDNRKENLYITEHTNNSTNRKGANSNSRTGVRNVNYIERLDEYWVQFMKKDERFKWVFFGNQFEEACEFAEKKRKELFGDFSGKS